MKAIYFDCFSGVSGDMMLGALLDLGIDRDRFINELNKLNLEGYHIHMEKKLKSAISVMDVEVSITGNEHNHGHHNHDHHHTARSIADIEAMIDKSDLSAKVKDFSKKVFLEVAKAEATVHNKDISQVHFHEVGAVDSIVDIVGVAICMDLLGAQKVYSSPLHDGTGFIECQHGKLPVPVPAVMEMLKGSGIPYITEDVNTELVTPTGMGLIKCMVSEFGTMPPMIVEGVGYGAGKRETGRFNALRCIIGKLTEENAKEGEVSVLETNIDDMNPEVLGYVMERLFENGALDVFYMPAYMKKNRMGIMLTVISEPDKEQKLVDIVLSETSTLGVRRKLSKRYVLDREIGKVSTEFGEVSIKISGNGDARKATPEYEECRQIAIKNRIPLRKVYDAINKALNI
jgi:uncharacterized protein (TIGR00299 family) protein